MSVYCADSSCKYSSDKNRCTAKQVTLSWHSVMTVWNGRQDFLRCRSYEMSDEELADWVLGAETAGRAYGPRGKKAWLDWLKEEAT